MRRPGCQPSCGLQLQAAGRQASQRPWGSCSRWGPIFPQPQPSPPPALGGAAIRFLQAVQTRPHVSPPADMPAQGPVSVSAPPCLYLPISAPLCLYLSASVYLRVSFMSPLLSPISVSLLCPESLPSLAPRRTPPPALAPSPRWSLVEVAGGRLAPCTPVALESRGRGSLYSCPASPPARPVPSAQRSFPHQNQRGPSTFRRGRGAFFSAGRPPGARGPLGATAPRAGASPSCSPVVGSSRMPCPGCPVALAPAPPTRVKPGGNKLIRVPGPAGPLTPFPAASGAGPPGWFWVSVHPELGSPAPLGAHGPHLCLRVGAQLLQAPGCGPGPWPLWTSW